MRKLNFNVPLHVCKRSHFYDSADRVLPRFQICDHQHLSDVHRRRHANDAALRKNDHCAGLFFEWFGPWRCAVRGIADPRTMNFYGNLKRTRVGAQLTAGSGSRLRLRSGADCRSFADGSCNFD
jgi:hypothetical protein